MCSLPVPISLSPSKVRSFSNCPQAFRYKYIDHLPEPETESTTKGTIVHKALELVYNQDPPDRVSAIYNWALDAAVAACGLEASHELLVECQNLIENITALENPYQIPVKDTELWIEREVSGHTYRGIIDRVDRYPSHAVHLIDYKTGKVPNDRAARERLHGLMFYAWLYGVDVQAVSLYYLAGPTRISAAVEPHIIEGLRQRNDAMWQAIERACERNDFRPRVGPLCSWCTFQAICPAWLSSESP